MLREGLVGSERGGWTRVIARVPVVGLGLEVGGVDERGSAVIPGCTAFGNTLGALNDVVLRR